MCGCAGCGQRFKRAWASLGGPRRRVAHKAPAATVAIVLGLSIVCPVLALDAQSGHLPAAPAQLVAYSDMNAPGRVWLSWNSPPHPHGAGTITHHEYRYRQSGSSRNWGGWTEIPFSARGQLHANQFAAGGLRNGVPFDFQVRAMNNDGAGLPSGIAGAEAGAHFGICRRTRALRDALVDEISDADDCAGVAESDLPGLTGSLAVRNALVTLMPGDLAGLTSLATLDLDGNSLGELPAGIFDDLTSLTRLSLSHNRLSGLPPGVLDGLPALQQLDLSGNRLSGLPPGVFDGLPALQLLDLSGNRLSGLPSGVFDRLSALEELRLRGNNLGATGLSTDPFAGLPALRRLDLRTNQLSDLPPGIFAGLQALEELRLGDNSLGALPPGIFDGLRALELLDLRANRLSALPDGIFSGLTNLRALYLEGNSADPMVLAVSLELDEQGQVRALAPAGAPFDIVLTLSVTNGSLPDGANTLTIPTGATASAPLQVNPDVRSLDTTVEIVALPLLPGEHRGCRLQRSADKPLVIPREGNATGAPAISGSARVGRILAADTGSILDADGRTRAENGAAGFAYSYRWMRVDRDGAGNPTNVGSNRHSYTLVAADAGRKIKVQVRYTDDAGNAEALVSAAYPPNGVIRSAGNATGAPAISGSASVGETLTADTDGILDADGKAMAESGDAGFAYSYRWVRVDRDGMGNPTGVGSDRATYTLVAADAGSKVKVQVSYTDDAGNAETLTSAAYPSSGAIREAGNAAEASSNSVSATRSETPELRVTDAEAQEGAGARLDFAVTLDRAAAQAVTVDYATADGTATAGEDYTAVHGTLIFAPGETEKTIRVTVLDDAHDEGSETLRLSLSNAPGAQIADGTATGTINNADPLPGGWLARFGRSGAVQVVEVLDTRFDEAGAATSELVLDGRRIRLPGWQSGRWSLWGRGALTHFGGRDREVQIDGDVLTGVLGLDYRTARRLTGLALSWSDGGGRYRSDVDSGTVDSRLAGVYPYGRYALNDALSVWGVAGYGRGEMGLQQTGGGARGRDAIKTGIGMGMGAVGIRGIVHASEATELAVKSDFLFVRTSSKATEGMVGVAGADASRLRLLLSGRHRRLLANDALLTPDFELGLRYDGGAAETGFGLELGGGLRYADPLPGWTLETRARGLIAHEDGGYEEWGLSGSVQVDPGRAGRGLMLRLASGWGRTESGTQALWQRQDTRGLAPGQGRGTGSRFSAGWSYGLEVPRSNAVLTPYGGVEMAGRSRRLRLGWRYELGQWLSLSLDGERRETPHARPQHSLMLRTSLPW